MHALDYATGRCRYCRRDWRTLYPLESHAAKQ
jgi:hypothetical protein